MQLTDKQKKFIHCLIQWLEYSPDLVGLSNIPPHAIAKNLTTILNSQSYSASERWLLNRLKDEFVRARENGKVIYW